MAGTIENTNGKIAIDKKVIEDYAGHAALDCFCIVGMASTGMKDGIVKMLKGDSISRGVIVEKDENEQLIIEFHIIVAYGVGIPAVVKNLSSNVKYQVEDYTGMKVKAVNVYVEGVRVID